MKKSVGIYKKSLKECILKIYYKMLLHMLIQLMLT